jgi:hypothetical protein
MWVGVEWVIYDAAGETMQPWPSSGTIAPPFVAAIRVEIEAGSDFVAIYRRINSEKTWRLVDKVANDPSVHKVLFDTEVVPTQNVAYRALASNHFGASSPYSPEITVQAK